MLLRTEGSGRDPGAAPPLISFYSGDPRRFYSSSNRGHLGGQGLTLRGAMTVFSGYHLRESMASNVGPKK